MKYKTLWSFLSPRTHAYIRDPTKWIYIYDTSTQPSGFTHFDSTTQPSGFTNLNKPFIWLNITIYIIGQHIWLFITNIKKTSREIIIQNHHNANNALYSARLMLPLKLCIQCILSIWPNLLLSLCNLNTFNSQSSRNLHPISENETKI